METLKGIREMRGRRRSRRRPPHARSNFFFFFFFFFVSVRGREETERM
jgi:hypothetical protein